MKKIQLSNKKDVALIDDEDQDKILPYKWHNSHGYVIRTENVEGKAKSYAMHRVITDCPEGMEVDHINCNKLDNRKENLRICTIEQNRKNVSISIRNTTGYKGVSFDKKVNKFRAYIFFNKKHKHLGHFSTAREAAEIYNKFALQYYGEYAKLNVLE